MYGFEQHLMVLKNADCVRRSLLLGDSLGFGRFGWIFQVRDASVLKIECDMPLGTGNGFTL